MPEIRIYDKKRSANGHFFFYSYDSQMASKRNWFNEFIRTITVYSDGIYTNEF